MNDRASANSWLPVALVAVVAFGASLTLGAFSDGVHHDDDLTHFMFARWAAWYPSYLIHVWGRPGLTVPLACVAWIGDREFAWHLGRALSAIVTLGGALAATAIARQMGLRYWRWVLPLCYVQPLNAVLSYTTLTENFTAFYLIVSLYLMQRRRFVVASAVFSLVFVSRIETLLWLPCWYIAIVAETRNMPRANLLRIGAAAITLWTPVVQNVVHFLCFGVWPATAFLRPGGSTEYVATGPLAFLPPLLLAASPLVMLLSILGVPSVARRGGLLLVSIAVSYLAAHWLIKWFGVFASGGFARFVVAVAPLLAIMAAAGAQWTVEAWGRQGRERMWIAAAGALFVVMCWSAVFHEQRAGRLSIETSVVGSRSPVTNWSVLLVFIGLGAAALISRGAVSRFVSYSVLAVLLTISSVLLVASVRPLRLKPEHLAARDIVNRIDAEYPNRPVFAANPWVGWWAGHVEDPRSHKGPALLSSMPVGTIVVLDSIYSPSDFHLLPRDVIEGDPAYRRLSSFTAEGGRTEFMLFEKTGESPFVSARNPYPQPLTLGTGERQGVFYERESESPRPGGATEGK